MGRRLIVDEIDFEVRYGKICAKTWHEETDDCKRVLLLHGWMDNSGSYDNLAPLLKHDDGLYIVALDLPGHGKSSQFPPGVPYSDMTMMLEIRRCLNDLGWTHKSTNNETAPMRKFSIIGHSFGGGLALFYASLYPDEVEHVILLDFLKPRTVPTEKSLSNLANIFDQYLTQVPSNSNNTRAKGGRDADTGQVVVTQETAIIATIEAHKDVGQLSREDATCLLKRSTVPVSSPPNSVIYSRDLRLQCMLNFRDDWSLVKVYFHGLKCHVMALLGKQGLYVDDPHFIDHKDEMEKYLNEKAESLHIQWITGDHYLHMNNAKNSALVINKYLESPKTYECVEI